MPDALLSWAKRWRRYLAGQIEAMNSGVSFTRTGNDDTTRSTMRYYQDQLRELDRVIAKEEMRRG